jgi:hypothetical protein
VIRISPWLTALAVVIVLVALGGIASAEDAKPTPEQTPAQPGPGEQAQADAQQAQEDALQQAEQAQAAALQAAQPPLQSAPAPAPALVQPASDPAPAQEAVPQDLKAQAAPQDLQAAQVDPVQQPDQPQKPAAVQQPNSLSPSAQAAANPFLAPPNTLNSASTSDPRFWDPSRSNNFDDWRDRDRHDDDNNRESIRNVRSGSANPSVKISNTGDNVNMCLGIQQVANTGNVANQQGLSQYNSDTDDVDFEGSGIEITPDLTVECNQTIIQAAAAGNPLAQAAVQSGALAPASAPASAPVAALASGGAAGPSVGLPVARGAGLAQLPRTGGLMTLPLAVLGLSGLGGGLMFWRLRR